MSRAKSAKTTDKAAKAESRRAWWDRYRESLRYALHVITHPFDGFWDLIHEKRGTLAAANTFLALFLITYIIRILYTNFQFMKAELQYLDVLEQMGSLLLPFLILCLANWAMTTLFEGKGRFKDIYIAMCYALVPYILIQLPMVLVSNMLTLEEVCRASQLLRDLVRAAGLRGPDAGARLRPGQDLHLYHCDGFRSSGDRFPAAGILQPAQ